MCSATFSQEFLETASQNKLYGIADQKTCSDFGISVLDFSKAFFTGGGKILQYRDKVSSVNKIQTQTEQIFRLAQDSNALLILNDYPQFASELGCGCHIGQEDLQENDSLLKNADKESFLWGLSTHNMAEIKTALEFSPHYIGYGSVFGSFTKSKIKKAETPIQDVLINWKKAIVLIGGISMDNVHLLPNNERVLYAVIRDFFRYGSSPEDIEEYTKKFSSLLFKFQQ